MFEPFELGGETSARHGTIQNFPDIAFLTFSNKTSCCILLSAMFQFAMVPLAKEIQLQGNGHTSSTA
jgi:hypothetical protein